MYWFASYRRVLRACALVPDVDILPDKDRTELGDKVARCLIIGTCCNVCFANWHSFLFRLHYIQNFSGIAIQNRSGVPTKCYREWSCASQKVQFQVYVLNSSVIDAVKMRWQAVLGIRTVRPEDAFARPHSGARCDVGGCIYRSKTTPFADLVWLWQLFLVCFDWFCLLFYVSDLGLCHWNLACCVLQHY